MKKIRKSYTLTILLLTSIILLPCCKSTQIEVELEWTTFPNPTDKVKLIDGDVVVMPLSYWLDITEYVADTETNIKILKSNKTNKPP